MTCETDFCFNWNPSVFFHNNLPYYEQAPRSSKGYSFWSGKKSESGLLPAQTMALFSLSPSSVTLWRGMKETHTAQSLLHHVPFCYPLPCFIVSISLWKEICLHRKCNSKYRYICKTCTYGQFHCSVDMIKPEWRTNCKCL